MYIQNRVIIELDSKDNVSASITSSTHDRKSRCNIFFRNSKVNRGRRDASVNISYIKDISILLMLRLILSFLYKVYLKHNSLGDDIPIVIVLKAMGLESDQEIVELVGYEPELVDLFSGSLEEPYLLGIYSRDEALSFIGNKVRAMRTSSNNGNFQVMK